MVDIDVEVADEEVREVILRHLVEQLVVVDRVGLVGQHEDVVGVTLYGQCVVAGGVGRHVDGTARPYIANVELAAMQRSALLHTTDNHTCHLADFTLRILLHHLLHSLYARFRLSLIQQAETLDEEEFRTVQAQWEAFLGNLCVRLHLCMAVSLEGFVGCCIDRVFDMYAKALVLCKVRVRKQDGPVALRIVALQHGQTVVGLCGTSLSGVEQEEVVPCLVVLLVVRILAGQPA